MESAKNIIFSNPDTMPGTFGYSNIAEVKNGRTLYISGQVALDPNGNIVGEGNLALQTRQVFENIKAGLAAAGMTFHDVVKLTFFLTDISQMAAVREIRDSYVNIETPPASSAVEVSRLIREEFLVEIEAIAAGAWDTL
ncbi:RidA family protein [Peribacillus kribbensis]|uniref:RidA family protein n=1 Tax=Peribacillus kribbensis TaxID=356658 RepID=UPI00041F9600|nr:RidA family protein [Peribacillus kribbensis]